VRIFQSSGFTLATRDTIAALIKQMASENPTWG
jgi:hypothetical protein